MVDSMVETFKRLITAQYDAALSTLNACIVGCPESAWNAPVKSLAFCQVAFHTLFFTDYYLGRDAASFRGQPFHRENADFFRDYEELEPRRQVLLYERPAVRSYLEHCRGKAAAALAGESEEVLTSPCGFERREFSHAELHVYTIRHIQHHAAQLILRLRLDFDADVPWFGSGWREVEGRGRTA